MSKQARRPHTHTLTISDDANAVAESRPRVIVHVSDTHDVSYTDIPPGDILVHSGDFTNQGSEGETARFNAWLRQQPHPHKVVVIGNHEFGYDRCDTATIRKMIFAGVGGECHLLTDAGATVDGVRFYGSPWNNCTQAFGGDEAFRAGKWRLIPEGTHVLVTHNPPYGVMDLAWQQQFPPGFRGEIGLPCGEVAADPGGDARARDTQPAVRRDGPRVAAQHPALPVPDVAGKWHENHNHWGCRPLLEAVQRKGVRLHLFGHVHDTPGVEERDGVVFSNAAMDMSGRPNVITILGLPDQPDSPNDAAPSPDSEDHGPTLATANCIGRTGPLTLADPGAWSANRAPVLDVDMADRTCRTLCLWKELSGHPPQQQWTLRVLRSLSQNEHVVAVESSLPTESSDVRVLCAAGDGARAMPATTVLRRDAPVPLNAQFTLQLVGPPGRSLHGYQCGALSPVSAPEMSLAASDDMATPIFVRNGATSWVLPGLASAA
eukprot:CAMPEP_0174879848 /NCGR_PEP_ID=MMETSP1114-20130205/83466_1 /TAXON_ID=312471 /ORGANISM="Neobodo designis, Strain CCAP 1951/1" /LENGTH=489 /DNA_ID=CAMNT_0016115243 /DNA_START=36 /DNA_END=1506 /DNA_ORIENTATION=-